MLPLPLTRHFAISIFSLFACALFYRYISHRQAATHSIHSSLQSQLQYGISVLRPESRPPENILSSLFTHDPITRQNIHIIPFLRCPNPPNPDTQHVRLPGTPFRGISLSTSDKGMEERFFNPTILPLPAGMPYPYLLVSRLVTSGLHQESHVCFAEECSPATDSGSQSSKERRSTRERKCTPADLKLLGSTGGIRCATQPQALNIPVTPAKRCKDSWSTLPDIPGFHDPRIFWSNKGEPLIIVNSASRYACLGLWVVDLRSVVPELKDELNRWERGRESILKAKIGYEYLTEITRNPRSDRGQVEKNWVLFFPKGEEAWVQYDVVRHGSGNLRDTIGQKDRSGDGNGESETSIQMSGTDNDSTQAQFDLDSEPASEGGSDQRTGFNLTSYIAHSTLVLESDRRVNTTPDHPDSGNSVFKHQHFANSSVLGTVNATEHEVLQHKRRSNLPGPHLVPSRSLALLLGHGRTTPNLTSPYETPCLDRNHVLDPLNETGQWHQGSNSLRLVLCTRETTSPIQKQTCRLNDENEDNLVEEGRVVHMMIMHKKFLNGLKLPMRYERYIMVWEARWPFRIIGMSRHPILFEAEMARPWVHEQNWPRAEKRVVSSNEEMADESRWSNVYFTYTPSLAWAWKGDRDHRDSNPGTRRLGTGYLGDEVIVGVGMDDLDQAFVKVKVDDLLGCLRLCPDIQA